MMPCSNTAAERLHVDGDGDGDAQFAKAVEEAEYRAYHNVGILDDYIENDLDTLARCALIMATHPRISDEWLDVRERVQSIYDAAVKKYAEAHIEELTSEE